MSCSPGTAPRLACACRTASGSPPTRQGLTICDATSAAFAQRLDWPKLDVVTFSWQKALGGEGAHGMLILSPRAVERLETYKPAWPLPKIFRLTKGGKLNEGVFAGETINTPSMLCVEDYLDALQWAKSLGGLEARPLRARMPTPRRCPIGLRPRLGSSHLAKNADERSNTSVCLKVADPAVVRLSGRRPGSFCQDIGWPSRKGRRRLRHRLLPRCATWPAHLVRCDR